MTRFGLFSLGQTRFAIDLFRLRKILREQRIFRLPRLPRWVSGLLVVDSQIVPVVNPARVGSGSSVVASAEFLVLFDSEFGPLAVPADMTCGIVAEQKGTTTQIDPVAESWVTGHFLYQDKLFQILDIDFLARVLNQDDSSSAENTDGARRHQ